MLFRSQPPSAGRTTSFPGNGSRHKAPAYKTRSNGSTNGDKGLVEALINSKVFQDYERAFTEATGLPVALRPVESWQMPHHGKRNESPFFCRNH